MGSSELAKLLTLEEAWHDVTFFSGVCRLSQDQRADITSELEEHFPEEVYERRVQKDD